MWRRLVRQKHLSRMRRGTLRRAAKESLCSARRERFGSIEPNVTYPRRGNPKIHSGQVMPSLFETLKDVKVQRALFTTYTFTPEWFEASLLPLLQRGNCKQICIILDNTEARSSIREAVSLHGGAAYRIMSVQPREPDADGPSGGIFHPKIAYIETDEEDLFLVGSGNLTPHGQGRQLEVLDGVRASEHPEVFAEVSAFFDGLRTRLTSLEHEDHEVLKEYATRAAHQAAKYRQSKGDAPQSAWLVTTLKKPAAEQFASLAKELGTTLKLTVLSPFHDELASATLRLKSAIGASKVRMGVGRLPLQTMAPIKTPRRGKKEAVQEKYYLAPFSDAVAQNKAVSFACPVPAKGELPRNLHAKWFEAQGKSSTCLVMTGSVNATPQSLWTLRNIEVSLARKVPKPTTEVWKDCDAPVIAFKPCKYPGADTAVDALNCTAKIVGTETGLALIVRFARVIPDRTVEIELRQNGTVPSKHVAAVEAGTVAEVPLSTDFLKKGGAGALWLHAHAQAGEAITWVNIEPMLQNSLEANDLNSLLDGILRDNTSEELYLKVARALAAILNSKAAPKKTDTTGSPKSGKENLVDAGKAWMHSRGASGKAPFGKLTQVLSSTIAALSLNGDTTVEDDEEEETDEPEEEFEDAEDGEDNGDPADKRRDSARKRSGRNKADLCKELSGIRARLDELFEEERRRTPVFLEALLPIKLNLDVTPGVLLYEAGGRPTRFTRVLLNLRRFQLSAELRHHFAPLFATVGVATAALYSMEGREPPLIAIRSHIEGLTGMVTTEAQLCSWIDATLSQQNFALPHTMPRQLLYELVSDICGAPQMESRVRELLHDAATTASGEPSISLDEEERKLFPDLVRRLAGTQSIGARVCVIDSDELPKTRGCPVCRNTLQEEDTAMLLRRQMLPGHQDCQKTTIVLLRKASASHIDFNI